MGLEGDLREFSLINVMQIICMERRKAGLYVTRRGEEAVIYFDDGDVVYADAGHLKGEEAIYQLLTWTDGTFRTAEHNGQPGKNIVKNWNHLLIEGMRRLDEQRRDEPDVEDRTLSTTEAQHDRNLGDGLMVLLSNMEQGMAKLGDKKVQKRPESAKTVLSDLVNSAVEFGEQIPAARNTSSVCTELCVRPAQYFLNSRGLEPLGTGYPLSRTHQGVRVGKGSSRKEIPT